MANRDLSGGPRFDAVLILASRAPGLLDKPVKPVCHVADELWRRLRHSFSFMLVQMLKIGNEQDFDTALTAPRFYTLSKY